MVIGKYTDVFRGYFWLEGGVEQRGLCGGNFPWSNFSCPKEISMKGTQHFVASFKKKKTMKK